MSAPGDRQAGDALVMLLCIVAGLLFFVSLDTLWPLARLDLVVPSSELQSRGRAFLEGRGHDLDGYRSASLILVHGNALDYVEKTFGRSRTQDWIAEGLPLVYYRASFKKRGETVTYSVTLHPDAGVIGWNKWIDEDHPGARIAVDEARDEAVAAIRNGLRLDPELFEERSAATSEQPERRDHVFGFERMLSEEPELRERVRINVAGEEVVGSTRRLIVPNAASNATKSGQAPGVALETVGIALLAIFAVVAFFIFLARLRDGTVDLWRVSKWPTLVFLCLLGTSALETADLFSFWEPLWPQWISNLRFLVFSALQQVWIVIVLLAVVAAGDAMDRDLGARRGNSLWELGRGRLVSPSVVRASGRGFLIGLLCGGAMAAAVLALQLVAGASTSIQPRGFFFHTLNTASPAATSLLFFFGVALAEELGYRFYAGSWLMARTGRRWVAIVLPAIVYGLTHTNLTFLPPSEPFWARPLVLTLVGCVWGWAFLRYDALTVVLSHFTADLFIFNWPRLASGKAGIVAVSVMTICVPLLPAILGALRLVFAKRVVPLSPSSG